MGKSKMKTGIFLISLLAAILVMAPVCVKKNRFEISDIETFFNMTTASDRNPDNCDLYYRRNIRPVIKGRFPVVLERAYQYTGKTAYSLVELKGIIRCALLKNAAEAKTMDDAKQAIQLIVPTLDGMGADHSEVFTRIKTADSPDVFSGMAKTLCGELAEICLKDIEVTRSQNSALAEKRLIDLRFLILGLPENESEVVNITRIVWDELNANVNDIQIDKVRELLRGAYPSLML